MPRKPRYYYQSNFYHVMVQGDEKKYIFEQEKNKKKYLYLINHNAFRNDVEIIAYCLMDNHAHFLLFCPDIKRISKMMLQCNTSFGLIYNKGRRKVGHVFRERYRSECIYTKSHLINCIKYIHENPLKAKMCNDCKDYKYSSYNNFSKMNQNLLGICGFSPVELKNIHNNFHTEDKFMDDEYEKENIEEVFKEIIAKKNIIIGDDEYIKEIYCDMKKRTRASDSDIAVLIGINRIKLFRILKEKGIK